MPAAPVLLRDAMFPESDAQLIALCRQGCQAAYSRLLERYRARVFALAERIVGDRDDADDVAQATFVSAIQNLDSYKSELRLLNWLYRIAVNEALNLRRRRLKEVRLFEECLADADSPEDLVVRSERAAKLENALMHMEVDARTLIVLRYYADLSYQELGYVFDLTDTRIKSRLHEARCRLGRLLRQQGLTKTS